MVQWLRICIAMQGTQVQSLVKEVRSHVTEQLSLSSVTTEPLSSGAQATTRKDLTWHI